MFEIKLNINNKEENFMLKLSCQKPPEKIKGVYIVLIGEDKSVKFWYNIKINTAYPYEDNSYYNSVIDCFLDEMNNNKEFYYRINGYIQSRKDKLLQETKKYTKYYPQNGKVSFSEVFGNEWKIFLEYKKESYIISDYHCISYDCTCNDVTLHFSNFSDENKSFCFLYDFELDEIQNFEDINKQDALEMIETIKEKYLDNLIERRKIIKNEFKYKINKKIKRLEKKKVKNDFKRGYFNNKKIGRNDLCPCGSGKKYKKCCLII